MRGRKEISIAARATSNPSNNLLSVKRKLLVKIRAGLRATGISNENRRRRRERFMAHNNCKAGEI